MEYERRRMTDAIKTIDILLLFMMCWALLGGKHDGVTGWYQEDLGQDRESILI